MTNFQVAKLICKLNPRIDLEKNMVMKIAKKIYKLSVFGLVNHEN